MRAFDGKGAGFADAWRVRTTVFCDEQGYTLEQEQDERDATARHVVLYRDGAPVATGRYYIDDTGAAHIGRVAVVAACRRTGLGAVIVRALEDDARAHGVERFCLSAQCRAAGFYETLGYHAVGDTYMDGHVPHILMKKP